MCSKTSGGFDKSVKTHLWLKWNSSVVSLRGKFYLLCCSTLF